MTTFGSSAALFFALFLFLFAIALFVTRTARAEEVEVEGRALIGPEGLAAARETATRRALARAAELHSARVSAQSQVHPDKVIEVAQVNSRACTGNAHPLNERVEGNELAVKLRVQVDACTGEDGEDGEDERSACEKNYLNRLVVTGFAFEFPEQLVEEWDGRLLPRANRQRIESLTAMELARALDRGGHVLAVFDGEAFPYASPARAPAPHLPRSGLETPFAALVRMRQAQYVLSGVYREFGLHERRERFIEIEAFLHDGVNGAVLARQRFQMKVSVPGRGAAIFANLPTVGTRAFRETSFGRTWTNLIEKIARWAEGQASCFPFVARVVKVEGRSLQIDAGAESRMSPGDRLVLHLVRSPPPVLDFSGRLLGWEKQVRAAVLLRAVYPAFSIAELVDAPEGIEVNPGDLLYAQ
ncbi:MAG: flagellar assembly protein T N-terminal domain-containing protein [Zoogloeaceae bacterium]|nr:flagellar assembly protein T N-terminal domain-containing protein [Zoogloeaceae bacterium]